MNALELFFGKRRKRTKRTKKSPGRKPKRGHYVKSLPKSRAFVRVKGRKRKLYRGKNGGLYYRTKSGRNYIDAKVLKRRGHALSPKRRRVRRAVRKLKKRKLKMDKASVRRRKLYRKNNPKKKKSKKRMKFGDYFY